MDSKLAVFVRIDLVEDMATYAKREMSPNTFGMPFTFLFFLELLFFALILKCGGLHILESDGRTVKERCNILHLMNPLLLHLV